MGSDLASVYAREYLKGRPTASLSYEDQAEAYRKLIGSDYDPIKDERYDGALGKRLSTQRNSDLDAYRNLFSEVTTGGGWKGKGVGTGEYQLKADPSPWGGPKGAFGGVNRETNAQAAERLKRGLQGSAYEDAVMKHLFTQSRVTDEAKLKELGDAGTSREGSDNYWVKLHNNLTGEDSFTRDFDKEEESNFYRKYKKQIIMAGAGVLGFAVGGPAGALLAAQLAGTARDIYAARADRRKARDAKRDFENEEAARQAEIERLYGPHPANLFRSAGEGVVDWSTSDVDRNKRKDTYVRNAT